MKIALLAPPRFPIAEPFHGGLEMHTHLLARELLARGHEVTLFAHPGSDKRFTLEPVVVAEDAGTWVTAKALRSAVRKIAVGDFDVVHNNSIHFLPPLLARALPFPMVTTLHTPPYRIFRLTAGLTRRSGKHHYASISHFLGRQWARYIGDYTVIPNGLDLSAWPYAATSEPGTAVWYGRFTPEKGARYAILAARAAGYRLTLAGPVYDRAYFDREIAPLLGDDVIYAGHRTQAQLAALAGRSAVGIVTSVWDEPFGLVYAEMLACGTPVVGFDSGAAAEIVTSEVGRLVPKRDTAALTRVLGEIEGNVSRAACRNRVATRFPVAAMVAGYLALYEGAGNKQ